MIETRNQFDDWLNTALAEYSNVEPPLGFESRTSAVLRTRQRRPMGLFTAAVATAVLLAIAVTAALSRPLPSAPPVLSAKISVPAIERVVSQPLKPKTNRPQRTIAEPSVRGVPIVASPITPQEEAVLRLFRNSRAKQLAGLVVKPRDLSKETDLLQFEEMEIPVLGKEERQ